MTALQYIEYGINIRASDASAQSCYLFGGRPQRHDAQFKFGGRSREVMELSLLPNDYFF